MSTYLLATLSAVLVAAVSCERLDHLQPHHRGYNGAVNSPFQFDNVNNGDGTYRFSYDANGISAHESGSPRASVGGSEGPAVTAEGGFSYRTADGQQISLTYTADENGFHPSGSHLPTPPPIPEAILRSIEFNSRNPSIINGASKSGAHGRFY